MPSADWQIWRDMNWDDMNARELRSCLVVLMIAVLVTVHIQLFAVFYVSTDTDNLGKSLN